MTHRSRTYAGAALDYADALPRYGVSVSGGRGFQVWDRHERRIESTHSTFRTAQRHARKLNRDRR